MNIEEFSELMKFVEEECSWKETLHCRTGKKTPLIKYVRSSFDTRDNKFWCITFNTMDGDKQFLSRDPENLKSLVWDFVRGN